MTDTTENREYNVPAEGESNWHEPVNENWESIDDDVQSLYDSIDETDSSGSVLGTSARRNVGALVQGSHHDNSFTDGGYGVVFEAADLTIESLVVDSDLSSIDNPELTIELRQYAGGADDPPVVDSTTVTLSGGPERVTVDFTVPAAAASRADDNNQYVIQRGPANGTTIPLRRRFGQNGDWSEAAYDDYTYEDPEIDFLQGTINSATSSASEPVGSWYYFFDWLVGPESERVLSPWSTDVDEIYMRPRDPEEEFDDVSPRALWIDTS